MQQNLKFPAQCTVIPAEELEQISGTVEALQLWAEKMMADGRIDRAAYTREISAAGEK